jgi:predicted small lipoprotein YifL
MNARLLALAICAASHLALGGCGKYGPPVREVPEAAEAEAPDAGSAPDARDDDEETTP